MPNLAVPSWLIFAGVAPETIWGTAVPATDFLPLMKPDFNVAYEPIEDDGYRSNAAAVQAWYQGVGKGEVDLPDMLVYPNASGHFLMGMLGVDTVTGTARTGTIAAASAGATSLTYTVSTGGTPVIGDIFGLDAGLPTAEQVTVTNVTGAGPFTLTVAATKFAHANGAAAATLFQHVITLNNTAYPKSYTVGKYPGLVATQDQIAGLYWSEVAMKLANPGKFTLGAKGTGLIQTQATKATVSYDTNQVYLPWQATFTIGGSSNVKCPTAELTLKRVVDPIWGMSNSQNATGINVDTIAVEGKLDFSSVDLTELNYYLNNTQPVLLVQFFSGVNSLTFQMSKSAWVSPTKIDHGSKYAKTTATIKGVANSTDGGTGNSPFKAILVNSRSTSY